MHWRGQNRIMRLYKIIVSDEANKMLTEHIYFLGRVNWEAAEKLYEQIEKSIDSLSQMPERYPFFDSEDLNNPYRKIFVPRWYLVLYKIEGDTVFVNYVLDGRSDYRILLD